MSWWISLIKFHWFWQKNKLREYFKTLQVWFKSRKTKLNIFERHLFASVAPPGLSLLHCTTFSRDVTQQRLVNSQWPGKHQNPAKPQPIEGEAVLPRTKTSWAKLNRDFCWKMRKLFWLLWTNWYIRTQKTAGSNDVCKHPKWCCLDLTCLSRQT